MAKLTERDAAEVLEVLVALTRDAAMADMDLAEAGFSPEGPERAVLRATTVRARDILEGLVGRGATGLDCTGCQTPARVRDSVGLCEACQAGAALAVACADGCGLAASAGDVLCAGCRSGRSQRAEWEDSGRDW